MLSAYRLPRRDLGGGISAIPAISATRFRHGVRRARAPVTPFPCGIGRRGRGISAISATHFRSSMPGAWFAAPFPSRTDPDGGVSAIGAISATHFRSSMPAAWFVPGPVPSPTDPIGGARAISAISATRFGRNQSARTGSSAATRETSVGPSRNMAGSVWLASDGRAGALRPKGTDMVPNLSASVGRYTPQHCAWLSRGFAKDYGLWRP